MAEVVKLISASLMMVHKRHYLAPIPSVPHKLPINLNFLYFTNYRSKSSLTVLYDGSYLNRMDVPLANN